LTLDISIDDFDAQRQALIQQLANQYGVDPSQITLEASAGSVQLTVTIATSNGTSAPVPLAELEQNVNSVDNEALTRSISQVMATNVTVTAGPSRVGNMTVVSLTPTSTPSTTRTIALSGNFGGSTPVDNS
jgi:hypothetical protein